MILHTCNAASERAAYRDCLATAASGDALILMGDAVYAAVDGSVACEQLTKTPAELYILADDAAARGVSGQLSAALTSVDMAGFVALTEQYAQIQAWY